MTHLLTEGGGGLLQAHMSTAYRYAHFWAVALTVLGTLFVLVGVLLAIVLILIPTVGGWLEALYRRALGWSGGTFCASTRR